MLTLQNILQLHFSFSIYSKTSYKDYELSFTPFNWFWKRNMKRGSQRNFGPISLLKSIEERDPPSDHVSFMLDFDIETHPTKEMGYGISISPVNWEWGKVADENGWSLYLGPITLYKMIGEDDSEPISESEENIDNFSHDS